MACNNDRTIFDFLNPFDNDMVSTFRGKDLDEFLLRLNNYYLEYRDSLGLDDSITFGIEIEIEHFKYRIDEYHQFQLLVNTKVGNERWKTKNDISLYNYPNGVGGVIDFGREISSDILIDIPKTWNDIKNVCDVASKSGVFGPKCASHVHGGAHILGDNPLYWYRFLKMIVVYENVIYRFLYGEYLTHKTNVMEYAKPGALFYESKLDEILKNLDKGLYGVLSILNFGNSIDSTELKKYGISFWHMLLDADDNLYKDYNTCTEFCTVECRAGAPTGDPVIWQNYINFFIKLLLYCKSPNFDEDILDSRKSKLEGVLGDIDSYAKIYFEQAVELCDMIFDNNLDKVYFLRQYFKSFEVARKPFVRARRFTKPVVLFD